MFVTNLAEPIAAVAWFYNQRAGAENLIKEANNDAGLAAHPSRRFDMNLCSTTIIFDHRDYDSCPLKWVFV